jgi:hypothetical protein
VKLSCYSSSNADDKESNRSDHDDEELNRREEKQEQSRKVTVVTKTYLFLEFK